MQHRNASVKFHCSETEPVHPDTATHHHTTIPPHHRTTATPLYLTSRTTGLPHRIPYLDISYLLHALQNLLGEATKRRSPYPHSYPGTPRNQFPLNARRG
ncbi:hypothetical protein E2C01_085423 [Portunus trituberculatus]|uniref:Uncharacterized protein n=1 Tax=Portunus trituberculatus TaxID=210409 RepID=A0A5B7J6S8_PORTR|nr:hypothetical protein [Portunus trituberculatus]